MQVRAFHIGKNFDLSALKKHFQALTVSDNPYMIEDGDNYAVFFLYGVVVLWGYSQKKTKKFLDEVKQFVVEPINWLFSEDVTVEVGRKYPDAIEDNELLLKGISQQDISYQKVALVSLVLSRSVALEYFEEQVQKAFGQFSDVIDQTERTGKSSLSTRKLMKKVGFAMKVRHVTLNQLNTLDLPDLTWESDELFQLYKKLVDEYDIVNRYNLLDRRLDTTYRDAEFILQFIETKKAYLLESIIILLIFIEIVIFVYEVWFK